MRKCKCLFCGEEFDRDKIPYVQVSERRYAHKACADQKMPKKTKEETDYDKLIKYISDLLGPQYIPVKVAKQIKDFREQYNYSYSGILGTLVYWFEVKKAKVDLSNGGIGIVPWIYDLAKEYYAKIDKANALNAETKEYQPKIIEIVMPPPQPEEVPIRLFKLEEGED